MAKRQTLRSVEISVLMPVFASLMAMAAIGVLVHGIMWSGVAPREAERALEKPPSNPARPYVADSNTLPA